MSAELSLERKKFSPKADLNEVQLNYEYDMAKYVKYSSTVKLNPDAAAIKAFLVEVEHALEKGLSIESTHEAFGESKVRTVIYAVKELERLGHTDEATVAARQCLQQYVELHISRHWTLPSDLEPLLRGFLAEAPTKTSGIAQRGGTIPLTKAHVQTATNFDYERFVYSRYSTRHYTGEPVSHEVVRKAVKLAIKTPRVCNREARRVYVALDPEIRSKLLQFHHGHAGFGHKLGALFVITADIREYAHIGERNQGWIDGGMFAMSLCFALHSQGLGTCMMNWSEPHDHDQRLRKTFSIPENEIVITFLGAGHIPEKIEVASSISPSVDDILSEIVLRQ